MESERKRINDELNKLRMRPPDLEFRWSEYAGRFRELHGLIAMKVDSGKWVAGSADYDSLARTATIALGYPDNEDGLNAWHMLLERDSSYCHGWKIENLGDAAAQYCEYLEAQFYGMKREAENKKAAPASSGKPETREPRNNGERSGALIHIYLKHEKDFKDPAKADPLWDALAKTTLPVTGKYFKNWEAVKDASRSKAGLKKSNYQNVCNNLWREKRRYVQNCLKSPVSK